MKILDFNGLVTDLFPYFRQYMPEEVTENLTFIESPEGYTYMLGSEQVHIRSIGQLNKLVYPIPFVWVDNMNCQ